MQHDGRHKREIGLGDDSKHVNVKQSHLAVILGQEEDKAIIAVLVAHTPLVVQGLSKELCLLCFASAMLKLHAVNKSHRNLQIQQESIWYACNSKKCLRKLEMILSGAFAVYAA